MTIPLITTKLFIPPLRAGRVPRKLLLDRLDDLLRPGMRLALISAPAGFGKTSLLAEWIALQPRPSAWLALDSGDNTSSEFLAYLLAALERAHPGLALETTALLRAQPPAPRETLLASLVNDLASLNPDEPLIIALDDFQFVTSAEVRETAAFLVEHLPQGARMVIATRSDPPLPLARLRARGQMVELRAADLRFSPDEAALFLKEVVNLPLDPQQMHDMVSLINERTEGWAAGLQMAGLALRTAGHEPGALIQTFSGSNRFVLDYLAEEVLAHLPDEMNAFLLQTAVLDRFSAELCAAIFDPQETPEQCQRIIEDLDRSNLFVIPLDTERRWFRYHHLFADLLRARLKQSAPGQIAGLHRRAADWFEANHLPADAIQHALASAGSAGPEAADQQYERAARLVEQNTIALFRRGELHALERWVSLLPEDLADRRPWLCIYRAWIANFAGQLALSEPLLQKAEAHLNMLDEAGQREMEGQCAAARCYLAVLRPDPSPVFALAAKAGENLPEDAWGRGICEWAVAFAQRFQGKIEEAGNSFERLARQDRDRGDSWGTAMNGTDWTTVRRLQGRLREALQASRLALEAVERSGARRLGYTGRLLTALAGVLYDQNDLEAAGRYLREAIELNQRWRNPNHLVYSLNSLARVRTAEGDFQEASDLLEAAAKVLRDQPVLTTLGQAHQAALTHLLIFQGKILPPGGEFEAPIQAALSADLHAQPFLEPRELAAVQAARLLLAQGRAAEALLLAGRIESVARQNGRGMVLIETLVIQSLAFHHLHQTEAALKAMREAVTRAAPEGIVRTIIDADPLSPGRLREILLSLRKDPSTAGFVEQLLAALPASPAPLKDTLAAPSTSSVNLVEPLTEREMEVLRLLAEGLTNSQIAGRLFITTGTVKAHTASIFRKLDAANRTQAVALAREAGLV